MSRTRSMTLSGGASTPFSSSLRTLASSRLRSSWLSNSASETERRARRRECFHEFPTHSASFSRGVRASAGSSTSSADPMSRRISWRGPFSMPPLEGEEGRASSPSACISVLSAPPSVRRGRGGESHRLRGAPQDSEQHRARLNNVYRRIASSLESETGSHLRITQQNRLSSSARPHESTQKTMVTRRVDRAVRVTHGETGAARCEMAQTRSARGPATHGTSSSGNC